MPDGPRTHIDLFSGIGGFTLACAWNGIATEVFCERDERCKGFLQRTHPDVPVVSDIREFDGTRWRGRFLLTAGVPCQPASRAGKQRGKGDDRWLWPETLRVISEARPDWVLCENPTGINDVGLGGILAEMEAIGYEIAPLFIIPACAVGSPQLRNRYWIVAHSKRGRCEEERERGGMAAVSGGGSDDLCEIEEPSQSHMADTAEQGYEGTGPERGEEAGCELPTEYRENFWSNSVWLTCADGKLRRAPDSAFMLADGVQPGVHQQVGQERATWSTPQATDEWVPTGAVENPLFHGGRKNRTTTGSLAKDFNMLSPETKTIDLGLHRSILAALGNSIVPQVAFEIIRAIVRANDEEV